MHLSPSDFYTLLRPSECSLRVYLRANGEREDPPSPYEEVIRNLGRLHEERHLATVQPVVDVTDGGWDDRQARTADAVRRRAGTIYHPFLRTRISIDGVDVDVVGEPDFIMFDGDRSFIRDCKIALRVNEQDHPEIFRSLELYGWLFAQTFDESPLRLEVLNGRRDLVPIPYDDGATALATLKQILALRTTGEAQYEPVGWTRCGDCAFNSRCWAVAESAQDIAMLIGVDQSIARQLHSMGFGTIAALRAEFTEDTLSEVKRPRGTKMVRIGGAAKRILLSAEAIADKRDIWIQQPALAPSDNYVMFDCEGLPPQLDETDKVYLWGLQVFGTKPGAYIGCVAGLGVGGDEEGWKAFLVAAQGLFDEYGDIPFVHWAPYERVKLDGYVARFGDPNGVAARVRQNLLDLFPITRDAVILPLPSLSLKVVERHVGFARTIPEGSGDWAMAKYVEAVEAEDESKRQALIDEICAYNREDLEATWAVFVWLQSNAEGVASA